MKYLIENDVYIIARTVLGLGILTEMKLKIIINLVKEI